MIPYPLRCTIYIVLGVLPRQTLNNIQNHTIGIASKSYGVRHQKSYLRSCCSATGPADIMLNSEFLPVGVNNQLPSS